MSGRRGAPALVLALAALASGCKKSQAAESQGPELFANVCSRCHGPNGGGGQPAFVGGPAPRNFRDHAFQESRTDEQLKMTIKTGKGTGMPAFAGTFDDAQLEALVRQIRSFDPENRGPAK